MIKRLSFIASVLLLFVGANRASAACVNRYVSRTEGPRTVLALLTGKLTFQEAQALAEAIKSKQAPPLEWVDESGKTVARQTGDLKVVRPMPVACDGKPSGVVMVAEFLTVITPPKKITVKLNPDTPVVFEQQAE